jgi:ferrous iron transport protein A
MPAAPVRPLCSLADLAPGRAAVVVEVVAPEPARGRLLDLGLLPGTTVVLRRRAPLGDPAVYELRGTQLCLRRSEAATVRVALG